MRILHLITRMDGGGSAVNTLLSAIGQQQAGNRVCLAFGPSDESEMTGSERGQLAARMQVFADAGGESVLITALMRSPGIADFKAYWQIKHLILRGFDIVHTHTSKAGTLGRLAARNICVPVVHTPHGHIFHGYFGWLMTAAFITIERRLARYSNAIVALTRAERDDHLGLGIGRTSQWQVIPSGVDVAAMMEGAASWRSGHDAASVWDAVSVGRLAPIKGMDRLLHAWAVVCREKPDARLAIVGDGERRHALESLSAALGISENVHFAGWCDPLSYLATSRSFALLSHNEGMGRAVVEAFAAGLPCVVSDVCGLRELVTQPCGWVVDADDAEAVAVALMRAFDADMLAACQKRAQDYSLQRMLTDLQILYEELVLNA
ncbi:MAG: glycosyltransferase [Mariprofundaceae bacterium]